MQIEYNTKDSLLKKIHSEQDKLTVDLNNHNSSEYHQYRVLRAAEKVVDGPNSLSDLQKTMNKFPLYEEAWMGVSETARIVEKVIDYVQKNESKQDNGSLFF